MVSRSRVGGTATATQRTTRLRAWIAAGVIATIAVTVAVLATGYDAREVPRAETGVWVSRDAGQYARVNTLTGELDTVRRVDDPNRVVQAGAAGLVLTHGLSRAWSIDPAAPGDFLGERSREQPASLPATPETDNGSPSSAESTPNGTREVLSGGEVLAVRTEDGAVFTGPMAGTGSANTIAGLHPVLAGDGEALPAQDAIALDSAGTLALFSLADSSVRRYDADRGQSLGKTDAAAAIGDPERAQIALVGGDWVLFDPDTGALLRAGDTEATTVDTVGQARLQGSSIAQDGAVLIADEAGLLRVVPDGTVTRIADAVGIPAQPQTLGELVMAAWLTPDGGTAWAGAGATLNQGAAPGKTLPLMTDPAVSADARELAPMIQSNGSRAVLVEPGSGMLWTLPEGRPIPVSQWNIAEPPKQHTGTVVVDEVTEPLPPVAVDDQFGVRAGRQAVLPVLLNDFDPNAQDILTIVPESVAGELAPADFGTLGVLPDAQTLTVRVAAEASGTAEFSYRITDGVHVSEPATVRLTVADPETNSAPVWCGTAQCKRGWPSPELAPGGTLVLPILDGWVDPEGDPVVLAAATVSDAAAPVRAVVSADGRLGIRHHDPNSADGPVSISVTVRDAHGAESERPLVVQITETAALRFEGHAATTTAGISETLRPLQRVSGGSGDVELVDAVLAAPAAGWVVTPRAAAGTITVVASEPGSQVLTVTVRDRVLGSEVSGQIRVTASVAAPPLVLAPLRAFIRPLQDSTVRVLDALPGSDERGVLLEQARVTDGALTAEVIDQALLRVAGDTPDGGAGQIGVAELTVTDGAERATGELTVFQVPEAAAGDVVSVPDSATVRAGSVVDIPVLDNDLGPRGERLALSPEVTGSGVPGELAFASGNVLRYLAPDSPGEVELSYRVFVESDPDRFDTGRVRVRVLPQGSNADPEPAAITVRVLPGQEARVQVPLTGVDPDGDRIRLVGVDAPSDPTLSTHLGRRGDELVVTAGAGAQPGLSAVNYRVRDGVGGAGEAPLRIVVGDPSTARTAPIAVTDTVRLVRGATEAVLVEPLSNDLDPAGGTLTLLSVVPNLPGGTEHPDYAAQAALLDTSGLSRGRVLVRGASVTGTVSYRYELRSEASTSTAQGLIVVQVAERVGAQAPSIADTVLSARDRAVLPTDGVDVVTDRVRWNAGDPAALTLSVWGTAKQRFSASEQRITGPYRAEGDLVPFRLAGTDAHGNDVAGYAFLTIPPLDEIRLTLRPGLEPISVDEQRSITVAAEQVLDLGPGDRIELRQGTFRTQRAGAVCRADGATGIRYEAGAGGPWADRCVIEVRLLGQRTWTSLPVPFQVTPTSPTAELIPVSRTIAPGAEERIDLAADLLRWQGDRAGDPATLTFSAGQATGPASVTLAGNALTVRVSADAQPGSQTSIPVSVSGAGESKTLLTIRVGQAPKDAPRGANVALQCRVGEPCRATVIGASGEHDPFAGTSGGGLRLDTVGDSSCRFASFARAGARDIEVAWSAVDSAGGSCAVPFTVRDAQGRAGTGTLTLDALGAPPAPASIGVLEYSADSLSFRVLLGDAERAHPAVSEVRLHQDGRAAGSCSAEGSGSFRCTVGGLVNGSRHSFSAVAVNEVGASPASNPVTAWAYRAPEVSALSAEPTLAAGTSATQGAVRLRISSDGDARGYRIENTGQEISRTGTHTETVLLLPLGDQRVSVTPLSEFEPPIPGGGAGGQERTVDVRVAGSPGLSALALDGVGERSLTVSGADLDVRFSERDSGVIYRIGAPGAAPASCVGDGGGGLLAAPGDQRSGSFDQLKRFERYTVIACGWNGYGIVESGPISATIGALGTPELLAAWRVQTAPADAGGDRVDYGLEQAGAARTTAPGSSLVWEATNSATPPTLTSETEHSGVFRVRQCLDEAPERCSDWLSVPVEGAPNPVSVSGLNQCVVVGQPPAVTVDGRARGALVTTPTQAVPGDPGRASYTLSWSGAFASLAEISRTVPVCATPGALPTG